MTIDKQALLDAVNDLIHEADPTYKLEAIEAVSSLRRVYPVVLSSSLSVLNPLIELRVEEPERFPNIQRLIDDKRSKAGLPLCWPEPGPERFDKTAYQRNLMAMRRVRSGRALDIENSQRPERDHLRGNARLEFERLTLANWGKELDKLLEAQRQEVGGRLSKEQQEQIRENFWSSVDRRLDEREELVRKELLKPVNQRKKV